MMPVRRPARLGNSLAGKRKKIDGRDPAGQDNVYARRDGMELDLESHGEHLEHRTKAVDSSNIRMPNSS